MRAHHKLQTNLINNINIMRQSAHLVVNLIMVNNLSFLYNCTPVGRTSGSMMDPT